MAVKVEMIQLRILGFMALAILFCRLLWGGNSAIGLSVIMGVRIRPHWNRPLGVEHISRLVMKGVKVGSRLRGLRLMGVIRLFQLMEDWMTEQGVGHLGKSGTSFLSLAN